MECSFCTSIRLPIFGWAEKSGWHITKIRYSQPLRWSQTRIALSCREKNLPGLARVRRNTDTSKVNEIDRICGSRSRHKYVRELFQQADGQFVLVDEFAVKDLSNCDLSELASPLPSAPPSTMDGSYVVPSAPPSSLDVIQPSAPPDNLADEDRRRLRKWGLVEY